MTVFKIEGDYKRILKFLEANNKQNLNFGDTLLYISRRPRVKRELSYYVLHILTIKAGTIFRHESVQKAQIVYQ